MELADSRLDMVVREGGAKPDIRSPEGLRQVLLHAKSSAYSDSASGVYIERELFKKLGIEDQVKAKAKSTVKSETLQDVTLTSGNLARAAKAETLRRVLVAS